MSGKFCQRWMVLSATDVALCTLLDLDNGVILKYVGNTIDATNGGIYQWSRVGPEPDNTYIVLRAPTFLTDWNFGVINATGQIVGRVTQPKDEQLLFNGADDDPVIVGDWGVPHPVGTISFHMYRRQADALAAFPSAQPWNF